METGNIFIVASGDCKMESNLLIEDNRISSSKHALTDKAKVMQIFLLRENSKKS